MLFRSQTVSAPDGSLGRFEIEAGRKEQLMLGLDDIGYTLNQARALDDFEARYYARLPWLAPPTA